MFWRKDEPHVFDPLIVKLAQDMMNYESSSDEFAKAFERMSKLYLIKAEAQATNRVSKDTLAFVTANLLGIFMIINHERVNVIRSAAMSFVLKPRPQI